jgi:hypothetical protein
LFAVEKMCDLGIEDNQCHSGKGNNKIAKMKSRSKSTVLFVVGNLRQELQENVLKGFKSSKDVIWPAIGSLLRPPFHRGFKVDA